MLTSGCCFSIGCKLVTLSVRSSKKNTTDTLWAWAVLWMISSWRGINQCYHTHGLKFSCFDFADPPQPVSRFVGSEEILSRDHADVATFLVKQDAYIDTFARKYLDEIGAYRLPRYDTPAVKLAACDVSSMNEPKFASNCGTYVGAGLWIARNSRPEIPVAVGWLGRYTTKWTKREDAALHRLMGYLAATQ